MAPRKNAVSKASRQVEEQLARYRAMRDFHVTAEPSGTSKEKSRATPGLPFVVQKHAATRLHYDFRLGWNGVLKSWAVTKGPSFFTGDKRLAVEVEDHPIEYAGFEGTIPKGQYGGGTVMVWDFGDWKPLVDVERGLREGSLKFELHGKKLKGAWALVRMKGRNERPDKPNWLLIKERDDFAQAESEPAITEVEQNSAVTHRTMDEIAAKSDHVWQSVDRDQRRSEPKPKAAPAPVMPPEPALPAIKKVKRRGHEAAQIVKAAPRERLPAFIPPQLAEQSAAAPDQKEWIHEIKLDGYRVQIHVRSSKKNGRIVREARLFTRKGLDWTHRMPDIARAAETLGVSEAILDGEAVVLNQSGIPDFSALQAAFQEGRNRYISYFAFDLLHLDGHNLRDLTLVDRKQVLSSLLSGNRDGMPLRMSEHFEGKGSEIFSKACALGAEGIVSKLAEGPYQSGRSSAWRKTKCILEQEFVVIGFTEPSKGGHGIGALLLGYYEKQKLCYAGRAGTGFTQKTSGDLRSRLNKLVEKSTRLDKIPADARRGVFWVRPELVAQVAFATWTKDDLVRQAAFKGLREDKPANEVERERAMASGHAKRSAVSSGANGSSGIQRKKVIRKDAQVPTTSLPITHPGKILDPQSGMTKQMLAEYYLAVAERMLPHVADRPLSIVRCPDGIGGQSFFQKHIGMGMPEGVKSVSVPNRKTGKKEEYLTLDSAEGLVGLAQMSVLEIHPWGSRNEDLEKPDRIVFDLDPDEAISWPTLAGSAEELRARLKKLGLTGYLKHTGGKGLHIVLPIEPEHPWPVIKEFAHSVVLKLEKEQPNLYVTKMTKAIRKGRIYLDYLRNEREATSIAPFSPRARSGAPVAVTMAWNELEAKTRPVYHVADLAQWRTRLSRDPWKKMDLDRQKISTDVLKEVGMRLKG
ncbi:MAG TPA: DNA ligase D [Terracidiphilus sp.]|nr:DNA ligase D [Terracidiphilus sp.]